MKTLAIIILTALNYLFPFAPSEGYVNRTETDFRSEMCLNGSWDFLPADGTDMSVLPDGGWDATKIKIPSPWNINSFANSNLDGPDHRNYPSYPKSWEDLLNPAFKGEIVMTNPASSSTAYLFVQNPGGAAPASSEPPLPV